MNERKTFYMMRDLQNVWDLSHHVLKTFYMEEENARRNSLKYETLC